MFRCSGSWNSFGAIYYWTRLCGAYTMDATVTNSNQCKYFSPSVLPNEYSWNEYAQKPKVFPIQDLANNSRAQPRQMIADSDEKLATACSTMRKRPVHIFQMCFKDDHLIARE